jgi:flagellar biosynthetic protein FlhB
MVEEETYQERTEQATAKRRQDFREKGQVAQSKEVHTAAILSTSLLLWYFYGSTFWVELSSLTAGIWRRCGEFQLTELSIRSLAGFVIQQTGLLIAPILLLTLVVGFFSSFLQIGWLFTTKPLTPDFSKLDPIKGSAKFISKRSFVEIIKSLLKVLLVGVIAYKTVAAEFSGALLLVDMDLFETIRYLSTVAFKVLVKSCGILIVLGLFDYAFVRWEMEQKMKMTKQQQKEEFKESEGDPHVKSRIRSIQQQAARKRMMAEVPKADVVVTNPTRLSVALAYRREEMNAPQVVARGADHLAMRIRELAREHDVTLVENVPVARALHKLEVGATVPEELFKAVAEILAYVYNLKGRRE